MTEFNVKVFIVRLFLALRRLGFDIGICELLDSIKYVEGAWRDDGEEELKGVVKLLWCNSVDEMHEFEKAWQAIFLNSKSLPLEGAQDSTHVTDPPGEHTSLKDEELVPSWQQPEPAPETAINKVWTPLPVRSPYTPVALSGSGDLSSYWPVSRRFMSYVWRYLRRPVNDGPADVLDVNGTVEKAARQGFYLAPVYQRRSRNYAHLILLIDQGGSMTPFHRFMRNLIDTSQYDSKIGRVDVFYFHNVISSRLYTDSFMTESISYVQVLEQCWSDTSVLIVSDAGAARGHRRLERVNATTEFLYHMKQHTIHIAWLNPMPESRWAGTSAQIIAHCIPMFQLDADGLSNAIDVVRGQPSYYRHIP